MSPEGGWRRSYIATQTGVAIVDVSKDQPRLLTFYDSLRSAEEIVLRPPYAMILNKEYFASIDFSNINKPKALGECTTLDLFFFRYPQEALRSGDFVVTAQTEGGLYILDWSDITNPKVAAQFSTWERKDTDFKYLIATGLALDGLKTAYVMGYDGRRPKTVSSSSLHPHHVLADVLPPGDPDIDAVLYVLTGKPIYFHSLELQHLKRSRAITQRDYEDCLLVGREALGAHYASTLLPRKKYLRPH
jgi:hypothetical protein